MRFYRLFLLAVLVGFAAACHSPVEPKGPDNDPPDVEPSDGLVITQQQVAGLGLGSGSPSRPFFTPHSSVSI